MARPSPDAKPLELKVDRADSIGGSAALKEADAACPSPDAKPLELKVEPADAIRGPLPLKEAEKASVRKPPSFFKRVLRFGVRTAAIACLCGLAWAAGAYYSLGHSYLDFLKPSQAAEAPQNADRDELASAVRQMGDDIRALKTSVEALSVAQAASADKARTRESPATQQESAQTATGAAIAELSGRVGKLETESSTKLSQVNEQLASIERQIAASRAAARAPAPRKREHPHDAFDPSRDPTAPGVPRPLGTH